MIAISLWFEPKVRVGDKLRFDATGSHALHGSQPIQGVFIEPESGHGFLNITGTLPVNRRNWFLDWVYQTPGSKDVTIRFVLADSTIHEKTYEITVLSFAQDICYSDDATLMAYEPDIMRWLPDGYSSWNHIHRRVTDEIVDFFDSLRIRDKDGNRLTPDKINITGDVKELATLWSLKHIYFLCSNKNDDKFFQKYQEISKRLEQKKSKGDFAIDLDGDGSVDSSLERPDFRSMILTRG